MTDEHTPPSPSSDASGDVLPPDAAATPDAAAAPQTLPESSAGTAAHASAGTAQETGYDDRLERLGGEPAPVITPEEFARLQRQGQVNIDARGRVRTTRRSDAEAGVSLRKRRAWY
jgi:hypothetical protein